MNEKTRKRILPDGWYPGSREDVLEILERWDRKKKLEENQNALSVIVPHAGWVYSGETAFQALSAIPRDIQTIVIAGGHLGINEKPLAAKEETFNATLGTLHSDIELLSYLSGETTFYLDSYPDNTVEINLPIIKYLFPESRILWLRMPANYEVIKFIARNIYEYSEKNKKTIAIAGSTDLTHYGYNYGFHPHGTGKEGLEWVKTVNDREFIDYISDYQIERAIEHSRTNMSACSAGAAGLAAEYALLKKCKKGKLISYHTSYDVAPSDSFVGYAGIIFA